ELAQQVESPALIVVGRVVALREKLNWFSSH
ncbi:siroheme synthase, partial [Escherichia coli]|nr:siroheme synthase [Escherichia coli]